MTSPNSGWSTIERKLGQALKRDTLLTSHEVAELLQVNPSSVNNWIRQEHLQAFRTPGGHRRIRAGDVVRFLDGHDMPVPGPLQRASRKRLLWVDDDRRFARSLSRRLMKFEDDVYSLVVESGIEGLVQVGVFEPDLLVLDVRMDGGLDGIEVCRRLKAAESTRKLDVVFVSGVTDPRIESEALDAGARGFFAKPVDISAILAELGVTVESQPS